MYICYVDESGGFEAPNSGSGATPLMVIAGAGLSRASAISPLTRDLLDLNRTFYPKRALRRLDYVLKEIKGIGSSRPSAIDKPSSTPPTRSRS